MSDKAQDATPTEDKPSRELSDQQLAKISDRVAGWVCPKARLTPQRRFAHHATP